MGPTETLFSVCYLSGRNARKGFPSRALSVESNYGIEKGRTPLASTGVGKWTSHNRRCKVILTHDLWKSDPQSPAEMGAGLGSVIGNRAGRLNCTPRQKHVRGCGRLLSTQGTPPRLPHRVPRVVPCVETYVARGIGVKSRDSGVKSGIVWETGKTGNAPKRRRRYDDHMENKTVASPKK